MSTGQFSSPLCGCFADCTLCIITYLFPCYTAGKNAQAVGKSCCMHGCFTIFNFIGVFTRPTVRGQIREQRGIDGSWCNDCLMHLFCPFCALVQEAIELKLGGGQAMVRE